MSLTFKVTIPIESLETLQRMSPFYDTVYRVWERNDESEAVLKACKSIVTALKDIPYELTPKKTKGKDGPCPCGNDWCQVSGYEQEGSSHEDQDYDEVDDGSEVYDEIDAEECDHRSTSGSVFEKGIHDWESTQDVTNDDSARTIDRNTETDERVADTESPHDEREPTEFDGDETTESKDLARSDIQIDITVISNGDWSGNSYRMTLYYNDTWSELASKLKRSFTRFEDDDMSLSFYFGYSFYDEGCQAPLFKVSSNGNISDRPDADNRNRLA